MHLDIKRKNDYYLKPNLPGSHLTAGLRSPGATTEESVRASAIDHFIASSRKGLANHFSALTIHLTGADARFLTIPTIEFTASPERPEKSIFFVNQSIYLKLHNK